MGASWSPPTGGSRRSTRKRFASSAATPSAAAAPSAPTGAPSRFGPPDGGLGLLDLASGRVRTLTAPGRGEPRAFSPDGRTLSTAEDGGNVILWDVEEGVPTETLEGHAAIADERTPSALTDAPCIRPATTAA